MWFIAAKKNALFLKDLRDNFFKMTRMNYSQLALKYSDEDIYINN